MRELLFQTDKTEQTEEIGALLADKIREGCYPPFVALYGDLGVGKTALVRGFASVIAPGVAVRSPTFALVYEYRGKETSIFHFDMYRITGEDDLYSIGFDDYLARDGICLVEWSENIPFALPEEYLRVSIRKSDPDLVDRREIRVEHIKGEETLC
ncbi:MAG: tRNA (adenosine(37)-N6)-threonylcarbamoyltransferase complex ATPase subunit type 1 TsaE [Clostridia bacterium]|nr:tRNA (adenosine(37)-N6)-threonylcarbamoyltransferase complex ATPase subunit type 1 TsaE [Clostridia bacterium]